MSIKKTLTLFLFVILSICNTIIYLKSDFSDKINNLLLLLLGVLIQSIVIVVILSIYNERKEKKQFGAIDAKIKIDLNAIVTLLLGTLNISVVDKFWFNDLIKMEDEIEKALYKIQHYKDFPLDHSKVDSLGFYWFCSEKIDASLKFIDSLISLFPDRITPEIKNSLYELKLELSGSKNAEFWEWKANANLNAKDIQHNFHILNKTKDIYQHCYNLWKANNIKATPLVASREVENSFI